MSWNEDKMGTIYVLTYCFFLLLLMLQETSLYEIQQANDNLQQELNNAQAQIEILQAQVSTMYCMQYVLSVSLSSVCEL